MPKWHIGTVVKVEDINKNTRSFWLEVQDLESMDFIPGQFITMDLPIHEKRIKRWKSYSIASHPDGGNIIELCIVFQPGGLGTTYLFEEATIGTEIKFKGPLGVFTIPKNLDEEIIMIATGTGVAPYRCIMNYIEANEIEFKHIHVIFGCRKEEDILYRSEFDRFTEKYSNFKYDVALSRQESWNGYRGYVHQIYKEQYPEYSHDRRFYLCGWRNMIDEARKTLSEDLGYGKDNVIFELYG
ncbi:MAG: FAD-dependent oxidoreductase [Bacteroidia bacterium]|nr:FAD-dependent oxidoreductase [Bacteroidia bacterium]